MKKKMFDRLEIIGVEGLPEVKEGDDLTDLFFTALAAKKESLEDGDAVVVTSKIVAKSEGRVVLLSSVKPTPEAVRIAEETEKDPRLVQLVLNDTKEVVRVRNNNLIVETRHGFVCANAGVDESNVEEGRAVLLPKDPQRSAERLKREIEARTGKEISVLISDSFGRAFRSGVTGVCVGVSGSGVPALLDRRGEEDRFGRIARITKEAVADEVCAAANLVMGEFKESVPIAIVRGLRFKCKRGEKEEEGKEEEGKEEEGEGIKEVLFNREDDLFR
ncbi:coenzyme F420-0:L-glutamate ligase [ANME-1 cluster archaeon ex4572_4]|nr:MAG: coenzyme F420-0:L-glutamate ligase [ANME-1 cluster archaeon ex4572_4]